MLTIQDYQTAISKLSERQREILKTLYFKAPFKDVNEIASVLKYKNFGAANLHIGTIGKTISKLLDIEPEQTYSHSTGDKPSYYTLVHDYFEHGWDLQDNLRQAIKINLIVNEDNDIFSLPTEISFKDNHFYFEGKAVYSLVNKYERDKKARTECLRIKGSICFGCFIDFKKEYGEDISNDLVHVHHLRPLHEIKKEEYKNVVEDLVPLCPNCHAVVHSGETLMSIESLRARRKNSR